MLLPLALAMGVAQAHDGHVASFELQPGDGGWVLSAHFPQEAVERALEERLGVVVLDSLDEVGLRQAAVHYLRQTVRVRTADGQPVAFGPGGIRLGTHQSDLKLSLPGLPATAHVQVELASFTEDPDQVHVLRVRDAEGDARDRLVLGRDQAWTAWLDLGAAG